MLTHRPVVVIVMHDTRYSLYMLSFPIATTPCPPLLPITMQKIVPTVPYFHKMDGSPGVSAAVVCHAQGCIHALVPHVSVNLILQAHRMDSDHDMAQELDI